MITRLTKPSSTVSKEWYVHCSRPQPPATAESVVQNIVRYATYPVGAYRTTTDVIEYLVGFETLHGYKTYPQFYTLKKLRHVVSNIMRPYHRIDIG
jgi:hypothetical protein